MANGKRWLVLAFALPLGGLLAWSLLTNPEWRAFDPRLFARSLVSIDWSWAAWALAAVYLTYLVRALRWKALMKPLKPDPSLWNLFSATVIGFAAIGVFGRAGEMARPYLVARKEGLPLSSQVGVWVVERSFDMLTILVTVAFALGSLDTAWLQTSPRLSRLLHVGANVVGITMFVLLLALVALRNYADPMARWLIGRFRFLAPSRLAFVHRNIRAFVEGSRSLRDLPTLAACTLYSVAEWILIAFCYFAVFSSVSGGHRLNVSETLVFMGAVMAGSMVQIPGVGGGIQVASLVVLTELFALQPETAAGISLLVWFFTFLAVVPPALLLASYEGLSWTKLRRLESEG